MTTRHVCSPCVRKRAGEEAFEPADLDERDPDETRVVRRLTDGLRAEREADADLVAALGDDIVHDAVDADPRQQQDRDADDHPVDHERQVRPRRHQRGRL